MVARLSMVIGAAERKSCHFVTLTRSRDCPLRKPGKLARKVQAREASPRRLRAKARLPFFLRYVVA
ncbi:hypothetical protein [Aneurinibacillus soli]|uniref:hypothetical protein n=1 Tax=Aneurinibacillus soli TaxID=1500254 RepID=UPI001E2A87B3|nr:hypothetical protein [Aneurinibacillus soli]